MHSRHPIRVLWVAPSMEGGGAERSVATVLTHLDPERVQPHLCLFRERGIFLEEVRRHTLVASLQVHHRLDPRLVIRLDRYLRQTQPDVTIAVLRYCGLVSTMAYLRAGRPGRLILNEQNYPSQEMHLYGSYRFKRLIMRWAYRQADRVLAISEGIREDLITHFGVEDDRIVVIPNPVADEQVRKLAQGAPPHPWLADGRPVIVSVGRLHPQKGHDLLLHAFARMRTAVSTARLILVGEGPQRPLLEQKAARLEIAEEVALVGFQENPYRYMDYATVFVLASRYEGFGIVLAEALTLGIPVVATDCPGGPREVLAGGKAGLLVPTEDVDALARALRRVIEDEALRERLKISGRRHAQRYAAQRVAENYTTFLEQLGER